MKPKSAAPLRRTPEQALIQKLARQVGRLHAIDALLLKGLAQ
jgi:hypothetical protein